MGNSLSYEEHRMTPGGNFLQAPDDGDTENGLALQNYYIPEEILTIVLSHVDPQHLLNASLVCRKWCRIIRSHAMWALIYKRRRSKKPKRYPWYVYYSYFTSDMWDRNLLQNTNGQDRYEHWTIVSNQGDQFRIEDPPQGSNPLPDHPDFDGRSGCFATSFGECAKKQSVDFSANKLFRYIVKEHGPHVYASEWVAGRFDCGCIYRLDVRLIMGQKLVGHKVIRHKVEQWDGAEWEKKELIIDDVEEEYTEIIFHHFGRDTQYWKGHYGSKMAGGVLKFCFETLKVPRNC